MPSPKTAVSRAFALAAGAPAHASSCCSENELVRIREPGTQFVLWDRELPQALLDWLDDLDLSAFPAVRDLIQPQEAATVLGSALDHLSIAPCRGRELLLEEVSALCIAFAEALSLPIVELRFEALAHDACWRFHRDHVPARLLVTYRGPGTEWVEDSHAEAALQDQRGYSGPIQRVPRSTAALFKGCCSPCGSGVVHRSPPIAGTGTVRLLLCLTAPPAVPSVAH